MMITRLADLTWRVELWDDQSRNPVETLAACTGGTTAIPAYEAACAAFPHSSVLLRQGMRVVRERPSSFIQSATASRTSRQAR